MKLTTCPICESRNIKFVKNNIKFQTSKGRIIIPNVPRQKCFSCGEEFFDHHANLIIDKYRSKKKALI